MNGYELTSSFYNYKFDSNGRVKHTHADLYFYVVYLWNKLGQKPEFGLPTTVAMEAVGMASYNTYKNTLNDLIDFGFIKLVKDSKNQHSAKIIGLLFFDKAINKALNKASINAINEASNKPTDTIIEQQILNYKQEIKRLKEESEFSKNENYALLSENESLKNDVEKLKKENQSLKDQEKKGKEKSSAKKESFVYDFPQDFSEEVTGLFMNFIELRNSTKGKNIKTQLQINLLIKKLIPFTDVVRKVSIENAIEGNWTSFFPKAEERSTVIYHNRDGKITGNITNGTPQPDKYQIATQNMKDKLRASMTP